MNMRLGADCHDRSEYGVARGPARAICVSHTSRQDLGIRRGPRVFAQSASAMSSVRRHSALNAGPARWASSNAEPLQLASAQTEAASIFYLLFFSNYDLKRGSVPGTHWMAERDLSTSGVAPGVISPTISFLSISQAAEVS